MKPKILINSTEIKIIKGGVTQTFNNTPDNTKLIKEHLQLTTMTMTESQTSAAYVVNGSPLAQTIETLKARQAEINKPDLPLDYIEALEKLTSETESSDGNEAALDNSIKNTN